MWGPLAKHSSGGSAPLCSVCEDTPSFSSSGGEVGGGPLPSRTAPPVNGKPDGTNRVATKGENRGEPRRKENMTESSPDVSSGGKWMPKYRHFALVMVTFDPRHQQTPPSLLPGILMNTPRHFLPLALHTHMHTRTHI